LNLSALAASDLERLCDRVDDGHRRGRQRIAVETALRLAVKTLCER
jgi:hypothetical protein